MKSDHGRWLLLFSWFNLMVQLQWSSFFKHQFTKLLGPSLGVNWMWIKRNDHVPKIERVDFLDIWPKKTLLERFKFHHLLVSLYSLIWDFILSQINIWTTTTWYNVWVVLPKPSWYEYLLGFLIWTPASKYVHLTTFSNGPIHVWFYPCSYICNYVKTPKKFPN